MYNDSYKKPTYIEWIERKKKRKALQRSVSPYPPQDDDFEVPCDNYDARADMELVDSLDDEASYEHLV